jgi:hypothetical protein
MKIAKVARSVHMQLLALARAAGGLRKIANLSKAHVNCLNKRPSPEYSNAPKMGSPLRDCLRWHRRKSAIRFTRTQHPSGAAFPQVRRFPSW